MVHLISYDLNGHERPAAYAKVAKIINDNAQDWMKPLYSQWFVKTELTTEQWIELLAPAFDRGDRAFVVQVQYPYTGWLTEEEHNWITANI